MKVTKTFENATLRTVNNGFIELDYNGKTDFFHNASVISVNNGSITIEIDWKPERGELIKVLHSDIDCYVIFDKITASSLFTFGGKEIRGCYYGLKNTVWKLDKNTEFHPVTPKEQQAFDDFCKSQGKIWNKEKLQWEKYRWKPQYGDYYYRIIFDLGKWEALTFWWSDLTVDINSWREGNCFQTKEQAETVLEKVKEFFKSL